MTNTLYNNFKCKNQWCQSFNQKEDVEGEEDVEGGEVVEGGEDVEGGDGRNLTMTSE
jgi:hypothetical protein